MGSFSPRGRGHEADDVAGQGASTDVQERGAGGVAYSMASLPVSKVEVVRAVAGVRGGRSGGLVALEPEDFLAR